MKAWEANRAKVCAVCSQEPIRQPSGFAKLTGRRGKGPAKGPGKSVYAVETSSKRDIGDCLTRVLELPSRPFESQPSEKPDAILTRYPGENPLEMIWRHASDGSEISHV